MEQCDYSVIRQSDGTYRLDRKSDPYPGKVAFIVPVTSKPGRKAGWRLKPIVMVQGSRSKVWETVAAVIASTKLVTPGQAKKLVAEADLGQSSARPEAGQ